MGETALIVEVPEAEPLVSPWRRLHDPIALVGVPGHITALFPFVPSERFDESVLQLVAEVVGATSPFEFELTEVDEFPGAIWLRPQPDEPFKALTRRIWSAFPEFPPYGGRFPDSQPHLTLAIADDERQPELSAQLRDAFAAELPIRCEANRLSVFMPDEHGLWRREHRLEFGG